MSEAAQVDQAKCVRDIRVDQIGFVNELQKQHVDNLKTDVKQSLMDKDAEIAEGDLFDGKLISGGDVRTIDPKKFHKLLTDGTIKLPDFLGAISVHSAEAAKLMGEKELDKISTFAPASPQLRVSRKKGVEVKLVDALAGLAKAINK